MLVHMVAWRLIGESPEEKRVAVDAMRALLQPLENLVPQVRSLRVGINCIDGRHCSDVVLVVKFDDQTALAAYQKHPEHLRIAEQVAELVIERRVIDFIDFIDETAVIA